MEYVDYPEAELIHKYDWFKKLKYYPKHGYLLNILQYNQYIYDYEYSNEYELKLMEDNKIKYYDTLYSRNSAGKIVGWNIQVIDKDTHAEVKVSYGLYTGNLAKKTYIVTEGKNIGKSNETNYLTQAIAEAKSKYEFKLNSGYVKIIDIDNIEKLVPLTRMDKDGDYKPMLAVKFKAGKLEYPQLIQPKLNGVRCEAKLIVTTDGLFGDSLSCQLKSRDGKIYKVKHIETAIEDLISNIADAYTLNEDECQEIVFDGELYAHGMLLQDIVSAVKKPNDNTHKIQYWIYDLKSEAKQMDRIDNLYNYLNLFKLNISGITQNRYHVGNCLSIVETLLCTDDDIAIERSKQYIDMGFEGAILREPNAPYQYGKRSRYLQKIKKRKADEFVLVDIIDSGNDTYNGEPIAMFVCKNDMNDLTFKVTPKATKQERREYLIDKNRYIGKNILVLYYERTKDNLPFHTNGIINHYINFK